MRIIDIINQNLIGYKFILNENFLSEESFDPGTILFIDSFTIENIDYEFSPSFRSFKVGVRIAKEDFEHNLLISKSNWYDPDYNPGLNIYKANYQKYFKGNQLIKPIESHIFVMGDEDCFDLDLSYYRDKKLSELGI
jgi:hypothetical protein